MTQNVVVVDIHGTFAMSHVKLTGLSQSENDIKLKRMMPADRSPLVVGKQHG